jgi:RNA polymerase sigma-70 factor (ECF subfamily)
MRSDVRSRLEDAIAALPPPYRAVLVLRDLEGLSTAETADALAITGIAVKVRLHRARLALRKALGPVMKGDDAHVP